jgi:hypothetical protein
MALEKTLMHFTQICVSKDESTTAPASRYKFIYTKKHAQDNVEEHMKQETNY